MTNTQFNWRPFRFFAVLATIIAIVIVWYYNQQPAYLDSYYHYNGAVRIATGEGFIEPSLWTYIAAPDDLPAPSHLYWMPGTSLVTSLGMIIFGVGFRAAQVGLLLCYLGTVFVAYWLGWRLGGTTRHAWLAGVITLFGGFFMRYWGQPDTFAPYAFFGSLALVFIGLGRTTEKYPMRWWVLAGIFAAAGHLMRTDGLLLLLVGWSVIFFPTDLLNGSLAKRFKWFAVFTLAYIVAMSPWFMRNYNAIGTILPTGGIQSIWYTSYDDLFSYPADANAETFFADGWGTFFETRRFALLSNQGILLSFIALEGIIILTPFMLIALWVRWRDPFIWGMMIFALGVHLAFWLVFPFPGLRGGLFHAVAALIPWWAALSLVGLDALINRVSKYRKMWKPHIAKPIFSIGMTVMVVVLSVFVANQGRILFLYRDPQLYKDINSTFDDDTRMMINDTPQLYYYTGLGGVPIPNESPDIALEIAEKYEIDYLIFERGGIPAPMAFSHDNPPEFLVPRDDLNIHGVRVYEFVYD